MSGATQNIDNVSGNDGGYANYFSIAPADMFAGSTYTIDLDTQGENGRTGWAAYIDYNNDGDFNDPNEQVYQTAPNPTNREEAVPYVIRNFTVPVAVAPGRKVLRIGSRRFWASVNPCGNTDNQPEEFEDYIVDIRPVPTPDIAVSGNMSNIVQNSTTASALNATNFGVVDRNIGSRTVTFTMVNNGFVDLILGAVPVSLEAGSSPNFTIINQPASGTIISSGNSTTFQIQFIPTIEGLEGATVNISSNDTAKNPFRFYIEGEGAQIYPDTDGDGVPDNIDIDDDNDGIKDSVEQANCLLNPLSTTADVIFLNETFGAGTSRTEINGTTAGVTTSYCYEDGTVAQGANECNTNQNLGDGKYTVHYSVSDNNGITDISTTGPDISTWAESVWYFGQDHTPGDVNGRMAIFNADIDPGFFYETEIVGTVPGAPIDYQFWALNIDRLDSEFPATELPRILPNVSVRFLSIDRSTVYFIYDSGDIPRCESDPTNQCISSEWIKKSTVIPAGVIPTSDFIIQLFNNAPGGLGNDLALDAIRITQTLCDLDNDGVADVLDIDNDNDGIPNVVEIGLPAGVLFADSDGDATLTGNANWIDANGNGMHDLYETHTPINTDGDNVADYLDLDSDNDGIFDVLEADGLGDLDVDGDGKGDGIDATSGVDNDEFDGDGFLGFVDLNDSDLDNLDHGSFSYTSPIDTDGDGIPDYLDLDSNDALNDLSNGSDINNSLYAALDLDNDGRVDGSVDADLDGVWDTTNDFDTGIFGAPIDVTRDLYIDFDGRNDYVALGNSLTSGLSSATFMSWVLLDPSASGTMTILGDRNMNVTIDNAGYVTLNLASGGSVNSYGVATGVIANNWFHLTTTYDSGSSIVRILVNGEVLLEDLAAIATPLDSNADPFIIARNPNAASNQFFNGAIDEIRVFNSSLPLSTIRKMMHQEIVQDGFFIKGAVIDRIIPGVLWNNLITYFSFNRLKGDVLFDVSPAASDGKMFNIKTILPQSAPLPYETNADGDLALDATLMRSDVWKAADIFANPYAIIKVHHNLDINDTVGFTGMIVDAGTVSNVADGAALSNSFYLKLDGTIDLLGDAQLLQNEESELDVTSAGKILRRQVGESDIYSYNYWSSPVGISNTTSNNNAFRLNMLKDTNGSIQFTGLSNPPLTTPATISTRWLYSFKNGVTYNDWTAITPATTDIEAGLGWSQKGSGGTLGYIFEGKPNNGTINILAVDTDGNPAVDDTESLLGNPYPSAIDARAFIDDNMGIIDGVIYLWDQFRGTNHQLAFYEGGYATITKLATVKAAQFPGLGFLNGGAGPAITPTFFLPVSQGFFVTIKNPGTIQFNNSQRVFKKEALGESIFLAAPGASQPAIDRSSYQDDNISLLRLDIQSDNGASRQIAIGFSDVLTDGYDYGYDALISGDLSNTDIFAPYQGKNYVIKSFAPITPTKVVDLGVKGVTGLIYKITASEIASIDPAQELWLVDNLTGNYHNLRSGDYTFTFTQNGIDLNRFDIVFTNSTLSVSQANLANLQVFYDSQSSLVYINNAPSTIDQMALYDLSGKLIVRFRESELTQPESGIKTPALPQGIYLLNLTVNGLNQSVKISVK